MNGQSRTVGAHEGVAQANGISVRYRIDGCTGPWVAFSNSLLTDLAIWDDVTAALADRFRVLRYDHCGHGGTESRPGTYTFDLLADDLRALLDALDIDVTHLVGISMGANTAAVLAHRYPERVCTLTMADCQQASTDSSRGAWIERRAVALEQGLDPIVDSAMLRWFDAAFLEDDPPRANSLRSMMEATSEAGYVGCVGLLADYDVRGTVDALQLPVLLMAGERDGSAPQNLASLARHLPRAQFAEVQQAGHLSCVDGAAEFSRRLAAFLDSHVTSQEGPR